MASTKAYIPRAADRIVFDRYHIMTHLGKAVNTVRKQEHRRLTEAGDDTLQGTTYLWLYAEENLPERYEDWFAVLKELHLQTDRAWALKESLRDLWTYRRRGWGSAMGNTGIGGRRIRGCPRWSRRRGPSATICRRCWTTSRIGSRTP